MTVEKMKKYLRVDFDDDDELIGALIQQAEALCLKVMRTDDPDTLATAANADMAILYAVSYWYEHREEADMHGLTIGLRSLLFGERAEGF